MANMYGDIDNHLYSVAVALERNADETAKLRAAIERDAEETAKLRAVMEQGFETIREFQKTQALDANHESEASTSSKHRPLKVYASNDVQIDEESDFSYE